MKNKNIIRVIVASILTLVFIASLSAILINVFIEVHTVSFNTNGGSTIESIEVKNGNKATKPTDPTKKNYAFYEWQLNGETFNFHSKIKSDITLDAVWNEFYTVTFDTNGSTLEIPSQTIEHGKFITSVEAPTKPLHIFDRWEVEGIVYDEQTPITGNVTFVAIYNYDVKNVKDFISLFSKSEVQANIQINNVNYKLDNTKMVSGNNTNGTYTQFNSTLNQIVNHGTTITEGNYEYYSSTKQEELPIYLSGVDESDFNFIDGSYVSGDIKVSYVKDNEFKIEYNNNTYVVSLQEGVEVDKCIVNQGVAYYYLFDDTAIALKWDSSFPIYEYSTTVFDDITYDDKTYLLKEFANNSFEGSNLLRIELKGSLEKIGDFAFNQCTKLISVDTNAAVNLSYIGESAFHSTALTTIKIPSSIKTIGDYAFVDCESLKTIYVDAYETDFEKGSLGINWYKKEHSTAIFKK